MTSLNLKRRSKKKMILARRVRENQRAMILNKSWERQIRFQNPLSWMWIPTLKRKSTLA
jgi:hypothetical protein